MSQKAQCISAMRSAMQQNAVLSSDNLHFASNLQTEVRKFLS